MVKTPRTRHSQSNREPVTIDLAPDEVSRPKEEQDATGSVEAEPEVAAAEAAQPETVDAGQRADEAAPDPRFGRNEQEPAQQPQPARRGGGMLVAGAAGGVIALALAGGLHFAGLLPGSRNVLQDHGPAIAALESQFAALQQQVSALDAAGGDAGLADRVTDAEGRVAALDEAVEAIRSQLAAIQLPAEGETPGVDLSPLEERLAAMETAVAALQDTPVQEADLSQVEGAIASLREEIGAAREAQSSAAARLDALEGDVRSLATRLEEQAEAPSTAIIIAASSLKAAIDRGTPFTTELDTFAALAPNAPEIEVLRGHAESGVATRAQLAAEADAAANAMIAAAQPVDPDAGITDRLWASAMGLVQVRPIGMVEGDGVPEIAARIDAAVGAGDFERAIAEYDSLTDTAKAAGAAFIDRVRARQTVDTLVDQALAAALKA